MQQRRSSDSERSRSRWGWAVACMMAVLVATPTAAVAASGGGTIVVVAGGSRALEATKLALEALHAEDPSLALKLIDARALATTRVDQLLGGELARLYARSAFTNCIEQASLGERRLASHVLDVGDLERLKQINQWIGLCLEANGSHQPARATFELAARLPGPDPDIDVFPPRVLERYRNAQKGSGTQRCVVKRPRNTRAILGTLSPQTTTIASASIDGQALAPQHEWQVGDHYVQWRTTEGQTGSSRIRIEAVSCEIVPATEHTQTTKSTAPGTGTVVNLTQARDPAFLQAAGRAAAADHVVAAIVQPTEIEVSQLDPARAEIVKQVRAVVATNQTTSDVLAGQIRLLLGLSPTAALRPVATGAVALSPATSPATLATTAPQPRPWYGRWWVWTLVGAGVAAAVAVPLIMTSNSGNGQTGGNPTTRYEIVF